MSIALAQPCAFVAEDVWREDMRIIRREVFNTFPIQSKLADFERNLMAMESAAGQEQACSQYFPRLRALGASLHDGHTFIIAPSKAPSFSSKPSVGVGLIEGVPSVVWVRNDLSALVPLGSSVERVDGATVQDAIVNKTQFVSASTTHKQKDVAVSMMLEGPRGSEVTVDYTTPQGVKLRRAFERGDAWPEGTRLILLQPWITKRSEFRSYDEGAIAYFSARDFRDDSIYDEFARVLPELKRASTVILDIRFNSGGSSKVGYKILSHFLNASVLEGRSRALAPATETSTAKAAVRPVVELPRLEVAPAPEELRLSARLIVLTNHETVSAAEDFLSLALVAGAQQVGEVTAGSTGEMKRVDLPSGATLYVLQKWDQAADGSEFVGIGFIPSVNVTPKMSDLLKGRDTVVEKALEVARTRPHD